jgi:hypothetical protein
VSQSPFCAPIDTFYAGDRLTEDQMDDLLSYVSGTPSVGFYDGPTPSLGSEGSRGNATPEDRKKIEEAAVKAVREHYEADSWSVERVDTENRGWDLHVTNDRRLLLIEVKGRSGEGSVEPTPNEFKAMRNVKLRMRCRLAIVFDAISSSPRLSIFSYAPDKGAWLSDKNDILTLREATSAFASF